MTSTVIVTGSQMTLSANVVTDLPPGGVAVPANVNGVQVTLQMATADKLATGTQIVMAAKFSNDGGATFQTFESETWNSYGPNGFTRTNIDGTTTVNPDPTISAPLNGMTGDKALLEVTSNVSVAVTPQLSAFVN